MGIPGYANVSACLARVLRATYGIRGCDGERAQGEEWGEGLHRGAVGREDATYAVQKQDEEGGLEVITSAYII